MLGTQTTNFFGEFKFDGLDNGLYAIDIDAAGKKASRDVRIDGESMNLGFINL